MNYSHKGRQIKSRSNSEPNTTILQNFYYNDKKIYHFLQKDEVNSHRIAQKHMKSESHSILYKIQSLFNLQESLSFQKIKNDNSKFFKDFKKVKDKQQLKPFEESFKKVIKDYLNKGYKIPKLSSNHNIFKINALTETNKDKLFNIFLLRHNSKQQLVSNKKLLTYLSKIKEMVIKQIRLYKKQQSPDNNNFLYKPHLGGIENELNVQYNLDNKSEHSESENRHLLNQISKLVAMIDECIIDKIEELYNNKSKEAVDNFNNKENHKDIKRNIFNCYSARSFKNIMFDIKTNSKLERKQSRNVLIKTKPSIKQLKKQTFDFMNLKSFTTRSNSKMEQSNKTCPLDIQNSKKQFSVHSPLKSKVEPFTSVSYILTPNKTLSSNQNTRNNFFTLRSSLKSKKHFPFELFHQNSNIKSIVSSCDLVNSASSTCFKTFGKGFNLNNNITNKSKSDLIVFAYDKCKEKDFKSVKNALKIFLEKYKQMTDIQIENYFEKSVNNSDPNIIMKKIVEIKKKSKNANVEDKIHHMYSYSEDKIEMIKPTLAKVVKQDQEITSFDKQFIKRIIRKSKNI